MPVNIQKSAIKWSGHTTSERFVHALACSLVNPKNARVITLAHGPRAGQEICRGVIPAFALQCLVGNALATSTLTALIRRHPSLSFVGGKSTATQIHVDLPAHFRLLTDDELAGR